jgi:CheY-like chemotaxis protein
MSPPDNTEETSLGEAVRPMVLVVDDDEGVRDSLRDLLEDAGFDTIGARHGLEALNALGALAIAPVFILLDLMMPVMDGWAFCDKRQKSPAFSDVPVIAISAVEIDESDRPAGVDAFMSKPIDADKFARLAVRMAGRKIARARSRGVLH